MTDLVQIEHHVHRYDDERVTYLRRLRLIEGQVRGLARMIEDDQYCIDILTQVTAVTSALKAVSLGLLHDHLNTCVAEAARRGGPEGEEKLDEAMRAIKRLVR